ncbi:hypothetical protein [Actinomadura kijaniata]|uniref:hypothetical protein n=1 Tax=Actinomadura kijaniata TaxID=46161 RepID=UPI000B1CC013|nr:hypothetical protein [Actinomadura kijaniata]
MRNAALRALAGGALLLAGAGPLAGCGVLGGSNTAAVCDDTKKAFQQYMSQVRSLPANQPAPWGQAVQQLAGKVDGLAAKAEDAALKKTLKEEAKRLREAAGPAGTGDMAALDDVMKNTPARVGAACD